MTTFEQIFFWVSIFTYAIGSLLVAWRFVLGRGRGARWEGWLILTGLAANLLTLSLRVAQGGHLFAGQRYEDTLVVAAVAVAIYLVWQWKLPSTGLLGLIWLPLCFLLLGLGYFSDRSLKPLKAAFLSPWMMVHGLFALLGTVCFLLAAGIGVFYLLKARYPAGEEPGRLASLPSLDMLSELSIRLVLFGFFAWTVMLISGAIWAKDLYGSYWSWDPVETWSLISWLAWGIYVHLSLTFRRWGRLLAWLGIACLLTSLVSMWGTGLVTTGTFHNLQLITNGLNN